VERVEISEIEMRNKTVVTIGVAAMLAFTGFLYQRTRAESTTFEVLDAGYELKSCSDLGPCDGRFARFGECMRAIINSDVQSIKGLSPSLIGQWVPG
jgi:hypothetical protein